MKQSYMYVAKIHLNFIHIFYKLLVESICIPAQLNQAACENVIIQIFDI